MISWQIKKVKEFPIKEKETSYKNLKIGNQIMHDFHGYRNGNCRQIITIKEGVQQVS